jgi:ornithine--oxo-acid transaminase
MGQTGEYLCKTFGYDKMLPMNAGVEAAETACKIARRWGYVKKGIANDQATIIMANGNFWGRSITASGASSDPTRYEGFGPFTPGFPLIDFNDVGAFERILNSPEGKNVCGIFLEPIQGEQGVIIPHKDYFPKIAKLCKQHNVLLITDEI